MKRIFTLFFIILAISIPVLAQQATNLAATANPGNNTSLTFSWTNGTGTGGRIAVLKNAIGAFTPGNGTDYTTDVTLNFGTGNNKASNSGAGGIVKVISVTSSPVTVTGLAEGTTYFFQIYEFNTGFTYINSASIGISFYTSPSGSFTTPIDVATVKVRAWGGGGGGGGADSNGTDNRSGGGGAGGSYTQANPAVTGGTPVSISVGAGGTGGTGGDPAGFDTTPADGILDGTGATGGTSSFAGLVSAVGGIGGSPGVSADRTGNGGATTTGTTQNGGAGAEAPPTGTASDATGSGGGGGGAGTTGAGGGGGTTGVGTAAGTGGANGGGLGAVGLSGLSSGTLGVGNNASQLGGGGSGGWDNLANNNSGTPPTEGAHGGNGAPGMVIVSYNDNTAPVVTSIARQAPLTASTTTSPVTFRVTFNENVSNVDAADFSISTSTGITGGSISVSASTPNSVYDVVVSGFTSNGGTLTLTFSSPTIVDESNNAFAGTVNSTQSYTADTQVPVISSVALTGISGNVVANYANIGTTVTLLVTADASGYSLGTSTINGKTVAPGSFTDNTDGTYTFTYLVASLDTDWGSGALPFSIILKDAAGNPSTATVSNVTGPNYGYSSPNTIVGDAHAPTTQNAVFTANSAAAPGGSVALVTANSAGETNWFAPAATTSFVYTDGSTITTAAGNTTPITAATTNGAYKLFVTDAAGNYSAASTATLSVFDQASGISFTAPTGNTQLVVNWANGTGGNRLVILTTLGATLNAGVPINGTNYNAASSSPVNFTSGSNLASAGTAKSVFNGSGSGPVTVTNLTAGTTYTVLVYEYAAGNIYLKPPVTINRSTPNNTTPTVAATALTFSSISGASMSVQFTSNGGTNGASSMVVAYAGSAPGFVPADGVSYTANADYSAGTNQTGNGKVIAYRTAAQAGTPFTITGLSPDVTYYFAVFGMNGTAGDGSENYSTLALALTGSRNTQPLTQAIFTAPGTITETGIVLNWTNGDGDRRMVIMSQAPAVITDPTNQNTYTASSDYKFGVSPTGSTIGAGYVVYDGGGATHTVTLTNLLPGNTYNFAIYEYNSWQGSLQTTSLYAAFLTPAATSSPATLADVTSPTSHTVGALTTGAASPASRVVAGYWNATNTTLTVHVPLTSTDGTLDGGTIQVTAQNTAAGTTNPVNIANTGSVSISSADRVAGFKDILIAQADLAAAHDGSNNGFMEGLAGGLASAETRKTEFNAIVTDKTGNSVTDTKSSTQLDVDTNPPGISSGPFYYSNPSALGTGNQDEVVQIILNEDISLSTGTAVLATNTSTTTPGFYINGDIDTGGKCKYLNDGSTNAIDGSLTNTRLIYLESNTHSSGWTISTPVHYNQQASYPGSGNFIMDPAGNELGTINTTSTTGASTNLGSASSTVLATGTYNGGSTAKTLFAFSLQNAGASTVTLSAIDIVTSVDVTNLLSNLKLYTNTTDAGPSTDLGLTPTLVTASPFGINYTPSLSLTGGSTTYFYLVADIDSYFYSTLPTLSFSIASSSLPNAGGGYTVSGGSYGGSDQAQAANYFKFKDVIAPTVLSIGNFSSPIYSGQLTQTVKVVYNEPMNTATTPTITFSNGMTHWGTQTSTGWSQTTLANDTYTATFTHDGTAESFPTVTASVAASGGATDWGGNQNSVAASSSPTTFILDNTPPTIATITGSATIITTNTTDQLITVKYSEAMNNTVNPTIVFSASGTNFSVQVAGAWNLANDTYTITYRHDGTAETTSGVTITASLAKDANGNTQAVTTPTTSFDIDTQRPSVSSINRTGSTPTNASSITYQVIFTEAVDATTVNSADFAVTVSGTPTYSSTFSVSTVSSTTYNITVSSVNTSSGNSDIRLDLSASPTINDLNSNSLNASYNSGQVYTVDQIAPTLTSITVDPAIAGLSGINAYAASVNGVTPSRTTPINQVNYRVNFSETVSGLSFTDFSKVIVPNTGSTISINPNGTPVDVSGSQWKLVADYISGYGTVRLDFNPSVNSSTNTFSLINIPAGFSATRGQYYAADLCVIACSALSVIPDLADMYIANTFTGDYSYLGTKDHNDAGYMYFHPFNGVAGALVPWSYPATTSFFQVYVDPAPTSLGFQTGTITANLGSTNVIGTGTAFLSQLRVNDLIFSDYNNGQFIGRVKQIISDNSLVLTSEGAFTTFTGSFETRRPSNIANNTAIADQAGNFLSTAYKAGDYYNFSKDQPAASPTLTSSTTTTSVTVNWSDVSGATKYLVMLRDNTTGPAFTTPADGTPIGDDTDFSDQLLVMNIAQGVKTATFNAGGAGLPSGRKYEVIIYPYSLDPNCIIGTDMSAIDYNTSAPQTVTPVTTTASATTVTFSSSVSLTESTYTSTAGKPVFTFIINDDGTTGASHLLDNAPFKFSQLVILPGATPANGVDWFTAIAGAQLKNTTNGTTIDGVVSSSGSAATSKITFGSVGVPIPSTSTADFGYVSDDGTNTYTLSIWFNTTLGVPDNSVLNFRVDHTSFTTYDDLSSTQLSSRALPSGLGSSVESGSNKIDVTASALAFTKQPLPTSQLVLTNFTTHPEVSAVDATGNVDLDFTGVANNVDITNASTIKMNPGTATPLVLTPVSGIITFPGGFTYTDQGDGTLTATKTGGGITSASGAGYVSCNTVTVTYSNATTITAGTGTAIISSIATGAVSVFSFTVTDDGGAGGDGADTKISGLKFTPTVGFNQFGNLRDLIASATLTDNSGTPANTMTVTSTLSASGQLNTGDITFSSIPFAAGNLGYVEDSQAKIYTLSITLNTSLGGVLPATADGLSLVFDIMRSPTNNVTLDATGSTIPSATPTINSGTGNGVFQVLATKIVLNNTLSTPQNYDAPLSPVLLGETTDANGNRDLNYSTNGTTITANITAGGVPANPDFGTVSYPLDTSPTGNPLATVGNGLFTFDISDRVTSLGNGQNNDVVNFTISSTGLASVTVNNIALKYSGNSDIIKDPTFVHSGSAGNAYTPNILYADYHNASFTANTDGVALERFVIEDGGSGHNDTDGSPTVLKAITLNISNYLDLRTVALYNGVTKIAELPVAGNFSNVVGNTADLAFTTLAAFQANDDHDGILTVWATFIGNGAGDNDVVQIKVTSVTAGGVSSSFNSTGTSTNFATLTGQDNQIEVVATKIDFTTPSAARNVSINTAFTPYIEARDINLNRDLDFTGTVTALSNTSGATMSNGPVLSTTAFALGVLDFSASFSNFKFTSGNDNDLVTMTMTAGGLPTSITPILTLKTNTVYPGPLAEPSTVSSLSTDPLAPVPVFDFIIKDDDLVAAGTDALPTLISKIIITPLAGQNDITDWTQLIASATLSDGVVATPLTGTVNATNITFSGIGTTAGALGYITDDNPKTYTLSIVLKSALGGMLPATVDNLNLAFEVIASPTNIVVAGGSSTFSTSQNALHEYSTDSGVGTNAIEVVATELAWTTNPMGGSPSGSLLVDKDISLQLPVPVIQAMDANNNRDLNYVTSLKITNTDHLTMSSVTDAQSSTTTLTITADGTAPLTGGIYTFPGDFQYNAIGDGTMTALSSGASLSNGNTEISTPVTVRVGIAGTITPGALAEPSTISSLVDLTHTPAGLPVFDFTVNDDPGLAANDVENDGNPTRISSITITQGSGNGITNWDEVFAQVQLDDGEGHSGFGTINSNSLVFGPNLPNTLSSDPGYIPDNGNKKYTLTVWLKTNLSGTQNYPITIDGKNFVFEVLQANVATNVNGSAIKPGENQNSGANNTVTVVATKIDFTTPSAARNVSINTAFTPYIEARDINLNRDLDFTGTVTALSNTTNATMSNGPVLSTTAFALGVLDFSTSFSNFKFTSGNDNDNVTMSIGAGGLTTSITPTLTLKTNTVYPGPLAEPSIVSSLSTDPLAPVPVFDFIINDDDLVAAGTDALPTLISKIIITPLAGQNDITDWTQLIASATLSDGGNSLTGTVNATNITFSGIGTTAGALGYITDDNPKTYTLSIVLKSALGGTLPATVDNLNLAFEVIASPTNIVVAGGSSTFSTSQNALHEYSTDSGVGTNAIEVVATELAWTTNPIGGSPSGSLLVDKDISLQLPVPVIQAMDANNNRDLNYVTSLKITNTDHLTMSSVTDAQSSTTTLIITADGTAPLTGGIYTFPGDFQYNAIGDGTMTALSSGASLSNGNTEISTPVTVRVGIAGTITPGALAEPSTISSLVDLTHTPAGLPVFDFTVNDDPGLAANDVENDGNPTRISSITITQGSGNTITNWDEVFAQVKLDDGASPTPHIISGTINSNSLVFNLPNTVVADPGYIPDNGNKKYTLTVWLKTNLSGTQNYPITIDGKNFVFEVLQANVATNVNGSAIKPGENQNSGANNTVTVIATQLDITTPSANVNASISTDFPGSGGQVTVQARDVNANRDLDFIGKITSVTNPINSTMTGTGGNVIGTAGSSIQFGTTPFAGGVFMFPSVFQFTTGNNTQIVTLTIKADNVGGNTGTDCTPTTGDAICSGISPTITLLTSFESSLVGDPTFPLFANPTPPAIDYVNYQEATNIQNTGTSYELIRALLVDGSRSSTYVYNNGTTTATLHTQTDSGDGDADGDTDGATSNLTSISLSIKRAIDIRRIALYSNGVEIPGTEIDVTAISSITALNPDYTFTWSQATSTATNLILLTAPDDGQVPLSVRVSFRNTTPELNDADNIKVDVTAATITTGSQFYRGDGPDVANNPGPYIAGQTHSGGPKSVGIIDVVATSLDFTTPPSSFAGVTEPIGIDPNTSQPYAYGNPANFTLMPTTSPGTVMARDRFGLVDTGFAPPSISMTDAGSNPLLIPASFVNGVLSLNGMHYTSVGNGRLTIIADRNAAGTITTSTGSATVTGVGTNFNGELNVGSVIKDPSGNPIGTVLSIASSTSLTLAAHASIALTSSSYLVAVNSANSSSVNSKPCTPVTVLDVTVTYDNSGVVAPSIPSPPGASLKGGNTGYNIFGLKFTANNTTGAEPNLKGFTISFDVPFDSPDATIFKNLIVKEVNSTSTFDITSSTIGGTLIKGGLQAGAQIYDQIIVDLSAKPQSLVTGPISFFLYVDVDAKVNLATPSITPSFSDRGYGFPDDQNSIVSNGTSTGAFTGTQYSFASTQPPILLTTSTDLTSPYAGQPNVDPYLQQITLQFNTNVGSFDRGGAGNAELWSRNSNGTTKVADLIYSSSQSLASVNANNTVSNTYPTISYDIVDPITQLPLTQSLNADSVYFVKLIKGNYDAVIGIGQGITDFGLNFYGGISSNSTLYFKISSSNAPKLSNAKSAFNTTSIGTVTTTFDQFGKAFFLIVKKDDPAPTKAEMLDTSLPAAYSLAHPAATIGASGNYLITSINTDQTQVFTATSFLSGQAYDVYIIAENDKVSHGVPSPVVATGVYGSSPYVAGAPGPTTTIAAGSILSSLSSFTPNLSNSNFLICPDSYSTISSPIIVSETQAGSPTISFSAPYVQDFNILLPTGYQFDVTVKPNVQLFSNGILSGGDFSPLVSGGAFSDYKYTSNTVLNISFNNSTSNYTNDYIVITGLNIIGKSGSSQGNINWFYGNNVFTNTPSYSAQTFSLGTIALQAVTPLDFYNSYWKDNQLLFNALQPPGSVIGDALNKTVNTIPDNFADVTFPGQLQLIPDNRPPFNKADYLASFFSGNGVSGDLFTLNSVATGAAFNITITHTDLNGCVTQKPEQYLVYDHRNPISNKLGLAYPAGSTLAGTEQALVNTNWPAAANAISSQKLDNNELAGYTLKQLTVDLPSSEISANQAATPSANQFISGASWRTQIQDSILIAALPTPPSTLAYKWDYSSILNTQSSIVKSTPYKGVDTLALGLNDVYDYFKSTNLTPLLKSNYWVGGFLGNIEFTGIYNSTADNSVYAPFRQNVGLYVPAVPAVEVTSTIPSSDLSDITTGVNGVTVQSLGATNKIYSSYPGTAVFCEQGGIINISGYPLATSGVSSGVFGIYDYASYDFSKVFVPSGTISILSGSATVNGVNTKFTSELKAGATLYDSQGNIIGQVASTPTIDTKLSLVAPSPISIGINDPSTFRTNLNTPITYASNNAGFVDNANGSMTLSPFLLNGSNVNIGITNGYNDILVAYTYQENVSPAFGIGYLVIRVTPNPVPSFTIASAVANPGASSPIAFCSGTPITFDASGSVPLLAQPTVGPKTNSIATYAWNFGDANSGANINSPKGPPTGQPISIPMASIFIQPGTPGYVDPVLGTLPGTTQTYDKPVHIYNASSTYPVTLSLTSNWGCLSPLPAIVSPTIVSPTPNTKLVQYAGSGGNIIVGDIPLVKFDFTGNCVKDTISFTDHSKLNNTNNGTVDITSWTWDFGDNSSHGNGKAPYHFYQTSGKDTVKLTATTNVAQNDGCQASILKPISILKKYPVLTYPASYTADFETVHGGNPGWQVLDLSSGAVPTTWEFAIGGVTNKNDAVLQNATGNFWVTNANGSYNLNEKSALYTSCFDLSGLLRPMISFDSYIDALSSDGVVLQYSKDSKNITDSTKVWFVLGTTSAGDGPGLDWFNSTALSSSPGSNLYNPTGLGWSNTSSGWLHSKHELDTLGKPRTAIFRFALGSVSSSSTQSSGKDGFAIDNFRIGSRTRTILFENFTTTDDGGTASISDLKSDADSITAFVAKNISGTQLVNINYHIGFIGMDPFNMDNPADPSSRALYYNVNKVPYAFLDGIHYRDSTKTPPSDLFKDWGQREYDLNTLQLAKVDFLDSITSGSKPTKVKSNSDGSLQVDVNFTPAFDLPYSPVINGTPAKGGTVLQVAILEKQISGTGIPNYGKITTGETSFGYVLKKMLPDAVGTKFSTAIEANVPVAAGSFTWTPKNPHSNLLTVVVFLQNEDTKEVYQAFVKDNVPIPPPATAIEPITAENIKVYPNPSDQEFTIELPSPAQQNMRVTMANQLGQFTEVGTMGEGEQSKRISTQGLTEGVYILQLGSNGNALRTKVVVLHK